MSNNIVPLETIREMDRLTDISALDKRKYAAFVGGSQVSWQPYQCANVSNSSIQITTIPPDEKTIIDPKVYAQVTFRVTLGGTTTGGNLYQSGTMGPRAFPLSSVCSTVNATLNNQSISVQLASYVHALMMYAEKKEEMEECFSGTPCMPDLGTYQQTYNTNSSPFATYGANTIQNSRYAFQGISVVSNSNVAAVIDITVYEPIFLPGFMWNNYGLINVRNLNWLFTFGSGGIAGLNRVWSYDNTSGATNVTSISTSVTAFKLWYKFVTPRLIQSIPKQVVYDYHEIVPITQTLGTTVANAASSSITMSSLNLQAVPKLLYIYVRKQDSDMGATDADINCRIDSITLNFMNRTGLLASCTEQTLYKISAENGLKRTWNEWHTYGQSVLCLKLGKDIGLDSNLAPGLLINPQLSFQVYFTNTTGATITPQCYCQVVYEGALTISNGSCSKSSAVLSPSDVLDVQLEQSQKVYAKMSEDPYGGSLIDALRQGAESVGKVIERGVENLKDVGYNAYNIGKELINPSGMGRRKNKKGGDLYGGSVSGGAEISREELMEQERRYSQY